MRCRLRPGMGWPLAAIALAACSATPPMGPIAQDPAPATSFRVTADWDDLEAGAVTAAAKTESVVLGSDQPSPGEVVFEIGSIRDEPVELRARRVGPPDTPGGPVDIELTCYYGPFGDARQQQRFLDALAQRLGDLRGVDYRKVR